MSASTAKKGKASYRYCRSTSVDKKETDACPVRYAPAEPLKQFVVDHLRRLGREPELVEETLKQAHEQIKDSLSRLAAEWKRLEAELRRVRGEARQVMKAKGSLATTHLADLEEQRGRITLRLAEIDEESRNLAETHVDPKQAKEALALFEPVWQALESRERERLVRLAVERVVYEGVSGNLVVTFHAAGLSSLAMEAQGMSAVVEA